MTVYLVDTNVLLRFVKPDDRDYPLVRSAVQRLWTVGEDQCAKGIMNCVCPVFLRF